MVFSRDDARFTTGLILAVVSVPVILIAVCCGGIALVFRTGRDALVDVRSVAKDQGPSIPSPLSREKPAETEKQIEMPVHAPSLPPEVQTKRTLPSPARPISTSPIPQPLPFVPNAPWLDLFQLKTGQVGRIGYSGVNRTPRFRVLEILETDEFIGWWDSKSYVVKGLATKGLTDDARVDIVGVYRIGTKRIGGSRTVFLLTLEGR